jgi:hypothetical protein
MSAGIDPLLRLAMFTLGVIAMAVVRAVIGPGRRRTLLILAGTLGGISFGVAVAYVISRWTRSDTLGISASAGMALGWLVAWLFARRLPREVA